MKKFYSLLLAAAGTLLLGSCNSNDDDNYYTSISYTTTNLITSIESGQSFASTAIYSCYFNLTSGRATIGTNNLIAGNYNFSFVSQESPFTTYYYDNRQLNIIDSPEGNVSTTTGQTYPLECSDIVISNLNYWSSELPGQSANATYTPAIVFQYNIGNIYNVKTFSKDALYIGKTETSYPGQNGTETYENEKMSYRFIIDLSTSKATMIMYNARFAASMPIELAAIMVDDLDVIWQEGTYTIKGENLVPVSYEGTTPTPYPSFTFDSIEFTPSNSTLTQGTLKYTVAGRYSGVFNGSYLNEPSIPGK